VPSAGAKEFRPGDVRICNARHCVAIANRAALRSLASLIYRADRPAAARRPSLGVPYFELRYRNGYVAGIVATKRLDRFLSYGVVLGRFVPGRWYAVPRTASEELRRLAVVLRPLRLTRAAIARSR
jgi:hypothetical protein